MRPEAQAADADGNQHLLSAGLHGDLAADRGGRTNAAGRWPLRGIVQRAFGAGRGDRQSASIQKLRLRSARMPTRTFLRASRAFAKERLRMPASSPKVSEFDVFASGRPEIGQNSPTAKLYAQTLPRAAWARCGRRNRSSRNQECRCRTSLARGFVPVRLHAVRGGTDVCGRGTRGHAARGAWCADFP